LEIADYIKREPTIKKEVEFLIQGFWFQLLLGIDKMQVDLTEILSRYNAFFLKHRNKNSLN